MDALKRHCKASVPSQNKHVFHKALSRPHTHKWPCESYLVETRSVNSIRRDHPEKPTPTGGRQMNSNVSPASSDNPTLTAYTSLVHAANSRLSSISLTRINSKSYYSIIYSSSGIILDGSII